MTNPAASWLSPRTRIGPSRIEGRGLFASEPIGAGELVAVKGGSIFGRGELARIARELGSAEIQIGEDLFIGPVREQDREGSMIFSNHSCDPNLGVRGQIVFVAMRDVAAGEELTHDWAMTDDDDGTMECRCGSRMCRGVVTGKDWQKPELQERYGSFMSWYLQEKIARSRTIRTLP
ncbi:MAG TPA: SET domain-containing protein-lysine N-methyltransferase [Thermoanaerobaculia bacterium]